MSVNNPATDQFNYENPEELNQILKQDANERSRLIGVSKSSCENAITLVDKLFSTDSQEILQNDVQNLKIHRLELIAYFESMVESTSQVAKLHKNSQNINVKLSGRVNVNQENVRFLEQRLEQTMKEKEEQAINLKSQAIIYKQKAKNYKTQYLQIKQKYEEDDQLQFQQKTQDLKKEMQQEVESIKQQNSQLLQQNDKLSSQLQIFQVQLQTSEQNLQEMEESKDKLIDKLQEKLKQIDSKYAKKLQTAGDKKNESLKKLSVEEKERKLFGLKLEQIILNNKKLMLQKRFLEKQVEKDLKELQSEMNRVKIEIKQDSFGATTGILTRYNQVYEQLADQLSYVFQIINFMDFEFEGLQVNKNQGEQQLDTEGDEINDNTDEYLRQIVFLQKQVSEAKQWTFEEVADEFNQQISKNQLQRPDKILMAQKSQQDSNQQGSDIASDAALPLISERSPISPGYTFNQITQQKSEHTRARSMSIVIPQQSKKQQSIVFWSELKNKFKSKHGQKVNQSITQGIIQRGGPTDEEILISYQNELMYVLMETVGNFFAEGKCDTAENIFKLRENFITLQSSLEGKQLFEKSIIDFIYEKFINPNTQLLNQQKQRLNEKIENLEAERKNLKYRIQRAKMDMQQRQSSQENSPKLDGQDYEDDEQNRNQFSQDLDLYIENQSMRNDLQDYRLEGIIEEDVNDEDSLARLKQIEKNTNYDSNVQENKMGKSAVDLQSFAVVNSEEEEDFYKNQLDLALGITTPQTVIQKKTDSRAQTHMTQRSQNRLSPLLEAIPQNPKVKTLSRNELEQFNDILCQQNIALRQRCREIRLNLQKKITELQDTLTVSKQKFLTEISELKVSYGRDLSKIKKANKQELDQLEDRIASLKDEEFAEKEQVHETELQELKAEMEEKQRQAEIRVDEAEQKVIEAVRNLKKLKQESTGLFQGGWGTFSIAFESKEETKKIFYQKKNSSKSDSRIISNKLSGGQVDQVSDASSNIIEEKFLPYPISRIQHFVQVAFLIDINNFKLLSTFEEPTFDAGLTKYLFEFSDPINNQQMIDIEFKIKQQLMENVGLFNEINPIYISLNLGQPVTPFREDYIEQEKFKLVKREAIQLMGEHWMMINFLKSDFSLENSVHFTEEKSSHSPISLRASPYPKNDIQNEGTVLLRVIAFDSSTSCQYSFDLNYFDLLILSNGVLKLLEDENLHDICSIILNNLTMIKRDKIDQVKGKIQSEDILIVEHRLFFNEQYRQVYDKKSKNILNKYDKARQGLVKTIALNTDFEKSIIYEAFSQIYTEEIGLGSMAHEIIDLKLLRGNMSGNYKLQVNFLNQKTLTRELVLFSEGQQTSHKVVSEIIQALDPKDDREIFTRGEFNGERTTDTLYQSSQALAYIISMEKLYGQDNILVVRVVVIEKSDKEIMSQYIWDPEGRPQEGSTKYYGETMYLVKKNNQQYCRVTEYEILNTEIRTLLFMQAYGYEQTQIEFGNIRRYLQEAEVRRQIANNIFDQFKYNNQVLLEHSLDELSKNKSFDISRQTSRHFTQGNLGAVNNQINQIKINEAPLPIQYKGQLKLLYRSFCKIRIRDKKINIEFGGQSLSRQDDAKGPEGPLFAGINLKSTNPFDEDTQTVPVYTSFNASGFVTPSISQEHQVKVKDQDNKKEIQQLKKPKTIDQADPFNFNETQIIEQTVGELSEIHALVTFYEDGQIINSNQLVVSILSAQPQQEPNQKMIDESLIDQEPNLVKKDWINFKEILTIPKDFIKTGKTFAEIINSPIYIESLFQKVVDQLVIQRILIKYLNGDHESSRSFRDDFSSVQKADTMHERINQQIDNMKQTLVNGRLMEVIRVSLMIENEIEPLSAAIALAKQLDFLEKLRHEEDRHDENAIEMEIPEIETLKVSLTTLALSPKESQISLINQKLYKVNAFFVSNHNSFEPKANASLRIFDWHFVYVEIIQRAADKQKAFGVTEKDLLSLVRKLRQKLKTNNKDLKENLIYKSMSKEAVLGLILDCLILSEEESNGQTIFKISLSMVHFYLRYLDRLYLEQIFVINGGRFLKLGQGVQKDPELNQIKTSVAYTEITSRLLTTVQRDMSDKTFDIKIMELTMKSIPGTKKIRFEIFWIQEPEYIFRCDFFENEAQDGSQIIIEKFNLIEFIKEQKIIKKNNNIKQNVLDRLTDSVKQNYVDRSKFAKDSLIIAIAENTFPHQNSIMLIEPCSHIQWEFQYKDEKLNEIESRVQRINLIQTIHEALKEGILRDCKRRDKTIRIKSGTQQFMQSQQDFDTKLCITPSLQNLFQSQKINSSEEIIYYQTLEVVPEIFRDLAIITVASKEKLILRFKPTQLPKESSEQKTKPKKSYLQGQSRRFEDIEIYLNSQIEGSRILAGAICFDWDQDGLSSHQKNLIYTIEIVSASTKQQKALRVSFYNQRTQKQLISVVFADSSIFERENEPFQIKSETEFQLNSGFTDSVVILQRITCFSYEYNKFELAQQIKLKIESQKQFDFDRDYKQILEKSSSQSGSRAYENAFVTLGKLKEAMINKSVKNTTLLFRKVIKVERGKRALTVSVVRENNLRYKSSDDISENSTTSSQPSNSIYKQKFFIKLIIFENKQTEQIQSQIEQPIDDQALAVIMQRNRGILSSEYIPSPSIVNKSQEYIFVFRYDEVFTQNELERIMGDEEDFRMLKRLVTNAVNTRLRVREIPSYYEMDKKLLINRDSSIDTSIQRNVTMRYFAFFIDDVHAKIVQTGGNLLGTTGAVLPEYTSKFSGAKKDILEGNTQFDIRQLYSYSLLDPKNKLTPMQVPKASHRAIFRQNNSQNLKQNLVYQFEKEDLHFEVYMFNASQKYHPLACESSDGQQNQEVIFRMKVFNKKEFKMLTSCDISETQIKQELIKDKRAFLGGLQEREELARYLINNSYYDDKNQTLRFMASKLKIEQEQIAAVFMTAHK